MNSTAGEIHLNRNVGPGEHLVQRKALTAVKKVPMKSANRKLMPFRLSDIEKELQAAANTPLDIYPSVAEDEDANDIVPLCDASETPAVVAGGGGETSEPINADVDVKIAPQGRCTLSLLHNDDDNTDTIKLCNTNTFQTPLAPQPPKGGFHHYHQTHSKTSTPLRTEKTATDVSGKFRPTPLKSANSFLSTSDDFPFASIPIVSPAISTPPDVFRPIVPSYLSRNLRPNDIAERGTPHGKENRSFFGRQPVKNLTIYNNTGVKASACSRSSKLEQISEMSEGNQARIQCSIPVKELLRTPANRPAVWSNSAFKSKAATPASNRKTPKSTQTETANKKVLFSLPLLSPMRNNFKNICVRNVKYIVLNQLGRGGSSIVYHCYNVETGSDRAIKCVSLKDPNSSESFLNEVRMLEKLQNCDHIIRMYDYEIIKSESLLLIVLEKGGSDLSKILKKLAETAKHLSLDRLMHYWMELLRAVKQIHDNSIVHSDLKPANFLWTEDGVKLIDFGIASCVQNDMTSVVKNIQEGTFDYISPEALCNSGGGGDVESNSGDSTALREKPKYKISYRSDVWSLGCILYQFIYRRPPFGHIKHMWMKLGAIINHQEIDYPDCDWAPRKIIDAVKSCLQYDAKARPTVDFLINNYENNFYC